jgi:malonyl-CoA O-methyltransferase
MQPPDPYALDKPRLKAAFEHAAPHYQSHAELQETVALRMLERLDLVAIRPEWVLDAGAGTGYAARRLTARYPGSRVLLLDLARAMLHEARRQARRLFSRERYLQADIESLPLAGASMGLVFANLSLQWCNDLPAAFQGFRRVLRPEGLLMFSTLGPDTLHELRESWAGVDPGPHVHSFPDMHDVGDLLVRAGFHGACLDVERITLTYRDLEGLMRDLKRLGAASALMGRRRGLTGKGRLAEVRGRYERHRRDGVLPATYEVVYGHAWAPVPGTRPQDGSTVPTFPLVRMPRVPRAGDGPSGRG